MNNLVIFCNEDDFYSSSNSVNFHLLELYCFENFRFPLPYLFYLLLIFFLCFLCIWRYSLMKIQGRIGRLHSYLPVMAIHFYFRFWSQIRKIMESQNKTCLQVPVMLSHKLFFRESILFPTFQLKFKQHVLYFLS